MNTRSFHWRSIAPCLIWLAAVSGGCEFSPTIPEGTVACESAKPSSCPPGFTCVAGFCRSKPYDAASGDSGSGDVGADAPQDAPAEAPRDVSQDVSLDAGKADLAPDAVGDAAPDSPVCATPCQLGATRCASGGLQTCATVAGCPSWSTAVACPGRKTCQGAEPSASCACPTAPAGCGSTAGNACTGNNVRVCKVDSDGCVYEDSVTVCPAGKACAGSFPSAACTCPTAPAVCAGAGTVCESTTSVATCAVGANGCISITSRASCPTGKPCAGSLPNAACTCPTAPSYCSAGAGKSCVDTSTLGTCSTDSNGCMTGSTGSCTPAGQVCSGSAPNASCVCPSTPAACTQGAGSYCSANSSITCTASSGGCLTASTKTCAANEYCCGTFPSGVCTAVTAIGWYNDLGAAYPKGPGYLLGHPITVASASTLRKFGLLTTSANTRAQVALYTDVGGAPSALVAYASPVSVVTGRNEYAPTWPSAAPALAAGTYWIMVVYEAQVTVAQDSSTTATRKYISFTFGNPLPTTITGATANNSAQLNYYILVTPQ